jgi:hypothetical protein
VCVVYYFDTNIQNELQSIGEQVVEVGGPGCSQFELFIAMVSKAALAAASNHGGAEGDRTPDLLHAMQALSQLSYSPSNQICCSGLVPSGVEGRHSPT